MKVFSFLHKYFWRIICSVIAVCLIFITGVLIWAVYDTYSYEYDYELNERLGIHRTFEESYIYDLETGEKVIDDVEFMGKQQPGDSIWAFVQHSIFSHWVGGKRGYLNINTGKVIAESQFDKAWIFSSGVAAVCKKDSVYFIDTNGKPINDRKFPYAKGRDYLYEGEFCQIKIGDKYGIINKRGEWVVEPIWDFVQQNIALGEFLLYKDGNRIDVSYVADSIMKAPILEFKGDTIFVPSDTTIIYVKHELSKLVHF